MKHYSFYSKLVFVLAFTAIAIGFSAFSQKQQKSDRDSFRKEQSSKDNDTGTSGKLIRDGADWNFDKLDEQMRHLDIQMKNLDIQMERLDIQMKNVDIENRIDDAIKKIDVKKLNQQIKDFRKHVDFEKINKEVLENIKVNKLEMVRAAKEMEHVKENLLNEKAHIKLNSVKIREDAERAMKNAKKSMEDVREELRNIKEFTDVLERDGLIDKSKAYNIEVKNGELYIDGKKQSKEISDKYRKYYRKSDFRVNMGEGDEFRI